MTTMTSARWMVAAAVMTAAACGSDNGDDQADDTVDVVDDTTDDAPAVDATSQTFPAVCQELPLVCPDATSLANCEAGSGTAFGDCAYLPLSTGCVDVGCPSDAQLCRTAEDASGVCTHSCTDDGDCPIDGGGQGSCALVVPEAGIYTCVY